jgi:ParB family chromosome partitioning protein
MREITEIPLDQLSISKLNVRRHGGKDIASLARSIETQGLIYPLIVRAIDGGKRNAPLYEIVAGKRRYLALKKLGRDSAPAIAMESGEDAAAIELSLAENVERADMCPLDQCSAFQALARQGRSDTDIARTFSISVITVRRRLALASLVPEAHARYRDGDIDDKTLEALTLGSKERQRGYLKLLADPDQSPPPVWQLKAWMLGGSSINANAALFDLKDYKSAVASDLFNEASYLSDADEFWRLQRAEIDKLTDTFTANGWSTVTLLEPDQLFYPHQYEAATKAQGGHVIIKLNADGHVQIEKGLLPQSDMRAARKRQAAESTGTPSATGSDATLTETRSQPELSANLANYVDLVRHSTVAAALARKPKLALRVMLAQLIAGSPHVHATSERRIANTPEIAASITTLASETQHNTARLDALALLDFAPEDQLFNAAIAGHSLAAVLAKLMEMSDAQIMTLLAVVTADCLAVGSPIIDVLGTTLAADCSANWMPDATFFDLVRGKRVIEPMAREVLGKFAANAMDGTQARAKGKIAEAVAAGTHAATAGKTRWQPRWTQFPKGRYHNTANDTATREALPIAAE